MSHLLNQIINGLVITMPNITMLHPCQSGGATRACKEISKDLEKYLICSKPLN